MGILKQTPLLISLIFLISCAKVSYLAEQGIGQVDILWSARDNSEVLEDPKVPSEFKKKIKFIEIYKKYFYNYWQREPSDIYSKTTILKSRAVTYLVIASKPNEIKARKECFTFYGCFPYLGFFKKESAKEFANELESKGYETYTRDVLAYSTLGNLDDPILSSFFEYGKFSLTDTVFHELFHTIFFVKDEVDLNENLANYFAKEMLLAYYKEDKELHGYFEQLELNKKLKSAVTKHARKLQKLLEKDDWKKKKEHYLSKVMPTELNKLCKELKISKCWPARMTWNNASLAAFMTYEKNQSKIEDYASKFDGDLKKLLSDINTKYELYLESDYSSKDNASFEKYLFNL